MSHIIISDFWINYRGRLGCKSLPNVCRICKIFFKKWRAPRSQTSRHDRSPARSIATSFNVNWAAELVAHAHRTRVFNCFFNNQWANKCLSSTVRAPVFDRHQFFGTSEHYGKAHGSLLSGWMNYDYAACCWFPTSNNIWILPSQFWQIRFESYWLHCSKCRILVLLRYYM